MTADEYLQSILAKYAVATGENSPAARAGNALYPVIQRWAGQFLLEVRYSGSYAKGTAVRGITDVDLFISLHPLRPGTLKEVYQNLVAFLAREGFSPDQRNVSVRISYSGVSVDLVPGKKQEGNTSDHSLYRRRRDTWIKTNVNVHIQTVSQSGRADEIRILKIWRRLHGLDFPSFYLELATLRALEGRWRGQLAENVFAALNYLGASLASDRILDPANTNNVVSDDLTLAEKQKVAAQARTSAAKSTWSEIVW